MKDKSYTAKEKNKEIEIDNSFIKLVPQMIANTISVAKIYKTFYDSLIKEGFTKEEALEIVIARGLQF